MWRALASVAKGEALIFLRLFLFRFSRLAAVCTCTPVPKEPHPLQDFIWLG